MLFRHDRIEKYSKYVEPVANSVDVQFTIIVDLPTNVQTELKRLDEECNELYGYHLFTNYTMLY